MAFEGAISSLGATRGLDGSIDRVPDPPESLWATLAFLQAKCQTENIEIISIFEDAGGGHHGVMKREKFCTALKDNFTRCFFPKELLDEVTGHYGVGYKDQRGMRECVRFLTAGRPLPYEKTSIVQHGSRVVAGMWRGRTFARI